MLAQYGSKYLEFKLSFSGSKVKEHKCILKYFPSLEINSNSLLRPPLAGGYGRWAVRNSISI
jgi:hypothetical protein